MSDDRHIYMSVQGYKTASAPVEGKGLHWVTDVNSEIPVKIRQSGPGSERPTTLPNMFRDTVKSMGQRQALFVERGG